LTLRHGGRSEWRRLRPQLTKSVAQQLTYRDHFFLDSGADLKPLDVVGVNRPSGYVGNDFALEYIEVGPEDRACP